MYNYLYTKYICFIIHPYEGHRSDGTMLLKKK
jgi:hypothetical protein